METDVRRILQSITDTATTAAEEARSAAQSAKKAVSSKYDVVKLNVELSKLSSAQERLFADIGRAIFLIQSGAVQDENGESAEIRVKEMQKAIDAMLMEAAQLEHEQSTITSQLAQSKKSNKCSKCGNLCEENDVFCPKCGAKL